MFQLPRYGSCSCGFAFLHYNRQVLKPLCRQVNFYLKQSLQYCCKSYRNSKLVDQTSGRSDQWSWQNGLQRISAVRKSQPVLKITAVFPSSVCDPSLPGLVLPQLGWSSIAVCSHPKSWCSRFSQPHAPSLSFMLVLVMTWLLCNRDTVHKACRK